MVVTYRGQCFLLENEVEVIRFGQIIKANNWEWAVFFFGIAA